LTARFWRAVVLFRRQDREGSAVAGKVHHRKEDQILAEFLHWVMDGEALTSEEEREQNDDDEVLRDDDREPVPS